MILSLLSLLLLWSISGLLYAKFLLSYQFAMFIRLLRLWGWKGSYLSLRAYVFLWLELLIIPRYLFHVRYFFPIEYLWFFGGWSVIFISLFGYELFLYCTTGQCQNVDSCCFELIDHLFCKGGLKNAFLALFPERWNQNGTFINTLTPPLADAGESLPSYTQLPADLQVKTESSKKAQPYFSEAEWKKMWGPLSPEWQIILGSCLCVCLLDIAKILSEQ